MRRGRIRTLEFIVGGMLLGVLFDGLHRWLPSDWSDRYGSGVNQKRFENDLRTRRPGQATVKGLVIQPWRIRNPDGSEASFHIVISNHLDHLEYENGKPTPIWKRESFVAPIPFRSLDDRKAYPTVMAYLDSKATSAGPIPYQLAWWWIAPKSTAFWAAVGGLLIGVVWPLCIRYGPGAPRVVWSLMVRLVAQLRRGKWNSAAQPAYDLDRFSAAPAPEPKPEPVIDPAVFELPVVNAEIAAFPALVAAAPIPVVIAPLQSMPLAPVAPISGTNTAEFGADREDFYPTVVHAHPHHETHPPRGFALRELIVAIGISGILIALLLPCVAAARQRSARVQCMENLRRIGVAAQTHIERHAGYMPLCGWQFLNSGVINPDGVDDPKEKHFIYYNDGGQRRPVPVTAALAISLGVPVALTSRDELANDFVHRA